MKSQIEGSHVQVWVNDVLYDFGEVSPVAPSGGIGVWANDAHVRYDDVIVRAVGSICGNQIVEPGEFCDDGNTVSGDGCSETCETEIPLPPDLLLCQQAIGLAGRTFIDQTLAARQGCRDRQLSGDLSLALDCHASPTTDQETDTALSEAKKTLRKALRQACKKIPLEALGFPGRCSDPEGPPFSLANLQRCIKKTHTDEVEQILNREYLLP